ncbi:MAG: CoA pyrophosphatase [Gammaproteobacteria bacterium]|uniref:CoA pyrophosphatase n=1 Tax=Rhodoferax sp. TaxID=50421 RepID=UPI0018283AB0|nr:CoA pyrophosphatase [Rhodoferax sp.]MBU3897790.1 CoA pyrophosphatase [Gammaproteobacteria bacterium]MBA3056532.1 CoA pyrophosphatase [Rhodoferax sp.]MBU3997263.1 CoA pyrophosphatase [Gammaproteobacteria bacterium]MBU4017865.1 CoA pyrophosphatase [Gammaproteobacteria bacterium]MBU4078680.1 CoA pyrophosphatase [Gammaproteobacteria bacterium]
MTINLPNSALSSLPQFDPRQIPVIGVDAHLPAVPLAALQAAALQARFISPPVWQPEVIAEPRFSQRAARHAAVLVPIVLREHPTILLTERSLHLSNHSGQIAFPGGTADDEDVDAAATALREAQEEVGLNPSFVQVLGALPQYLTGSAFIITPVVALVQPGFTLTPNAFEVADIFEVPLEFLMNPAHHQRHAMQWQGVRREWFSMPWQDQLHQRFIWGATAGMLRNFYRLLSA